MLTKTSACFLSILIFSTAIHASNPVPCPVNNLHDRLYLPSPKVKPQVQQIFFYEKYEELHDNLEIWQVANITNYVSLTDFIGKSLDLCRNQDQLAKVFNFADQFASKINLPEPQNLQIMQYDNQEVEIVNLLEEQVFKFDLNKALQKNANQFPVFSKSLQDSSVSEEDILRCESQETSYLQEDPLSLSDSEISELVEIKTQPPSLKNPSNGSQVQSTYNVLYNESENK